MKLQKETNIYQNELSNSSKCSRQSITSYTIQNLRLEIAKIESMLDKLIDKSLEINTNTIMSTGVKKPILSSSYQEESDAKDDDYCSETSSIITNSTCTDDFSIQSNFTASSSNFSNPCIYDNLLNRVQRLEQYLTKPCRHCQQS